MAKPTIRRYLLELTAEGIAPVLGFLGGAVLGGAEGGYLGAAAAKTLEKAVSYFVPPVVERWWRGLRNLPAKQQLEHVRAVAELSPAEASAFAEEALTRLAPKATPAERALGCQFLTAIPSAVLRSLTPDRVTGLPSLPAYLSLDEPEAIRQLLPTAIPPYPTPCDLPGTHFRLEALLGVGGFGAVYKATQSKLENLTFAIKFCLDPDLIRVLQRERKNLDHLKRSTKQGWSEHVIKYYGCDLEHATPYLVYEYVAGGDLAMYLTRFQRQRGRRLTPDEIWKLVRQMAQALAFAHDLGLVHGDLKPANLLVSGSRLKLTDFGIGVVVSRQAATASVSVSGPQVRGGTLLYMSPEHRHRGRPEASDDIYSLGVVWYQLLVGDITRPMPLDWVTEVAGDDVQAPPQHIALLQNCVGGTRHRPPDAKALITLMNEARSGLQMRLATGTHGGYSLVPDRAGFPWLEFSEPPVQVALLPATKAQFEEFRNSHSDPEPGWYDQLLALNPAVPWETFRAEQQETLFVTGILPREVTAFCEWLGEDVDLLTVDEWRALDRVLRETPLDSGMLAALQQDNRFRPLVHTLIERLCRWIRPANWGELALFRGGLFEWVHDGEDFGALGSPRPQALKHTLNPQIDRPVHPLQGQRSGLFGFRLIRRRPQSPGDRRTK